jgi:chorismate synthase
MSGNSFGKALVLTTFGESHGVAVGGVLDGFPPGLSIDLPFIQAELDRRRPGTGFFSSARNEPDILEVFSGVYEGKSTGAPIAFLIRNHDQRPGDYDHLKEAFRPSHADYTWQQKFGIRDPRGGGRASARETVARVAAGGFAKLLLGLYHIRISAFITRIGTFEVAPASFENTRSGIFDPEILTFLEKLKSDGDTAGGAIGCVITGVPAGLGDPVFDKLQADLAKAMLSINAVKGFEYGSGFDGTTRKGSEQNDLFVNTDGKIKTITNHSGGIQGGISNGEEVVFRVAFKPVATLMMDQSTVTMAGEPTVIPGRGRHDVCVLPRALPVVEAMAALVLADHLLRQNAIKINR